MITIDDVLEPNLINLRLEADSTEQAIFQVASMLKGHPRVKNWDGFYSALKLTEVQGQENILIPHARTEHVKSMVMSIGRTTAGTYIFVIGVPLAMAADYLRIMGAMGRILRNPKSCNQLANAATGQEFLRTLAICESASVD